jgi:hypothetical protein
MTHPIIRQLISTAVVLFALFGTAQPAHAGWITVTNDTKQTILIQETSGPLNRPVRGKCIKLQPGETHREFSLLGGTRNVVIYDADALTTPLTTETMAWDKNDTAFTVKADGKKVSLGPAEKKK